MLMLKELQKLSGTYETGFFRFYAKYASSSDSSTENLLLQAAVGILFEIHNIKDDSGQFYVYYERQALKRPNEICTFLKHYTETRH